MWWSSRAADGVVMVTCVVVFRLWRRLWGVRGNWSPLVWNAAICEIGSVSVAWIPGVWGGRYGGWRWWRFLRRLALWHSMHIWWGFSFQPRAPSVKTLKAMWQPGHVTSFAQSTWEGVGTGFGGDFLCFSKEETADSEGEGRALQAISLVSTKAITSFIGFSSMPAMPSTSLSVS